MFATQSAQARARFPGPIACDVQALYAAVDAANTTPPDGSYIQITLQEDCTYTLTGRALELAEGSRTATAAAKQGKD